jgi:hypothetical protein
VLHLGPYAAGCVWMDPTVSQNRLREFPWPWYGWFARFACSITFRASEFARELANSIADADVKQNGKIVVRRLPTGEAEVSENVQPRPPCGDRPTMLRRSASSGMLTPGGSNKERRGLIITRSH